MNNVHDGPVVIVGGGVAGLVSAQLLLEAGCEVVVIERERLAGGLARSHRYENGDWTFDIGPHRFHTENPNIKAYLDRVIKGECTLFPRLSEVYFQGKYYRWPLHPKNLLQLPKDMAAKAFVDLAVNNFRTYEVDTFEQYVLRQYGPTLYKHRPEDRDRGPGLGQHPALHQPRLGRRRGHGDSPRDRRRHP